MAKITRLDNAFSEAFQREASPVKGQSLQQKDQKRRKRKDKNKSKKNEKPKDAGHKILISGHPRAKMS